MKIVIDSRAARDAARARAWYRERNPAVAKRFGVAYALARRRIREFPEARAADEHGIRRIGIDGFPYSLFYEITGDVAVVIAVLHDHRAPGSWR
jgi:plasmid stabilization system protein ParE